MRHRNAQLQFGYLTRSTRRRNGELVHLGDLLRRWPGGAPEIDEDFPHAD